MPFKERSFPPNWRPLDDIDDCSKEIEDGLIKICKMLGLETDDEGGVEKDSVELINTVMKHYGLPSRDAGSCAIHDWLNKELYGDYLSEAKKNSYTLVRAVRSGEGVAPSSLTTIFYLNRKPQEASHLRPVRIGLKGCSCYCMFFSGERMHGYCRHILYVLRFILNCPKELPFRDAFTRPEYDNIFAHSYPAQALKNAKSPNEDWREVLDRISHEAQAIIYTPKEDELLVCLDCFRPINCGNCARPCLGCGNLVHKDCHEKDMPTIKGDLIYIYLRHPKPDSKKCAVCRDKTKWEEWTQSHGPPLSGDYESDEEELDEDPLESKLERIKFMKAGKYYSYLGEQK